MVHVDDTGLASGMVITVRLTGGLVGLAIASAIFNSVFRKSIGELGGLLPEPLHDILTNAGGAIEFIPSLRNTDLTKQVLDGLLNAYLKAFRGIWIAMACFAGLCLLCTFFVKDLSLEHSDIGRQAFVDETQPPVRPVSQGSQGSQGSQTSQASSDIVFLKLGKINISCELSALYSKETWEAIIRQAELSMK